MPSPLQENDVLSQERRTGIFLQDACLQHRYIRSRVTSQIVERPERIRAVMIGLSAAIARLEEVTGTSITDPVPSLPIIQAGTADARLEAGVRVPTKELEAAMHRMTLTQPPGVIEIEPSVPVAIFHSQAYLDLLNHPAVKYVHGGVDGDVYLENLVRWAKESLDKLAKGDFEIPEGLPQGDLYLCPQSLNAIQGALGTVCEAVDQVMASTQLDFVSKTEKEDSLTQNTVGRDSVQRAFVVIRPPGHHCGEDTPSGFCFVNNVAVAAAQAHLQHGIQRIVIFDIDLHHGNGTQSIVWKINEETYRQVLEKEAGGSVSKTGPQIFYGSIHDILSYPCEDGRVGLVQAASFSIHKAHGQFIENVHLEPYTSEEQFWDVLYNYKYSRLLRKAEEFLVETGGPGDDVLVFISCGMDGCEHEYESMSRHGRKVPVSFYHQFTRDACAFSDWFAGGRIISVLEGGYSDRALISATMAHVSGLVTAHNRGIDDKVDRMWWDVDNLAKLEKATKQRKGPGGRKSSQSNESGERWLERTVSILATVDTGATMRVSKSQRPSIQLPGSSSMTLRNRNKGREATAVPPPPSTPPANVEAKTVESEPVLSGDVSDSHEDDGGKEELSANSQQAKKKPRVILRLSKQ
ncbi:hypothetical protein AX15_005879 [Amanita polypyramis BW_CC]|nr:hypothetical protein AX15_005879 [Amanita polypyramis BW_CC]